MSKNIANFSKLSELISLSFRKKPKIVLNPAEEYYIKSTNGEDLNANIICDKTEWKIPEELHKFVNEISQNSQLNSETKILLIFERLCKDYIYDDNILTYMEKTDDDQFALPDWYGRDISTDWEKNREKHNRRVCYEISRYLAKSLSELFENNNDFNVCILWSKELTHYFVGLTSREYSITLDLDDFDKIKDLTRIKTGLTIEGIAILEDDTGKFKNALDNFNKQREKYAIKRIKSEIAETTTQTTKESDSKQLTAEYDDITFFINAIEVLKENYNIDSQGLFEYMKEIVDIKLGPESRKKVWKKIEGDSQKETRYTRCLIININNVEYIIDADKRELYAFDRQELESNNATFIPYKDFKRDWNERYEG